MNKFKVDVSCLLRYTLSERTASSKREILMSNKEGEWHPYELTGDPHKCPRRRKKPHVDEDQIRLDDRPINQSITQIW